MEFWSVILVMKYPVKSWLDRILQSHLAVTRVVILVLMFAGRKEMRTSPDDFILLFEEATVEPLQCLLEEFTEALAGINV